jgi:hypothetical protein
MLLDCPVFARRIHGLIGLIGLAVAIAGFALLWGIFEILLGKELRSLRHGRLAGGV